MSLTFKQFDLPKLAFWDHWEEKRKSDLWNIENKWNKANWFDAIWQYEVQTNDFNYLYLMRLKLDLFFLYWILNTHQMDCWPLIRRWKNAFKKSLNKHFSQCHLLVQRSITGYEDIWRFKLNPHQFAKCSLRKATRRCQYESLNFN